jgi:predicted transcriptional regulator
VTAQLLDRAGFKTAEAGSICQIGLNNYFAGALQMPYAAFLKANVGADLQYGG